MAMTLRLSEEETAALRATAEREGRSMQDVARTAVALYTSDRNRRRDAAMRSILADRGDLLDRLGKA